MAKLTADQLADIPLPVLQDITKDALRDYVKDVTAAAPKALYEQFNTELKKRLSQIQPDNPVAPIKTEAATGDARSVDYRTMETMFKDSVTVFKPGQCVNKFIHQLENVYKMNVTANNGLEKHFCLMLANKLSLEYQTNLLALPEADRQSYTKVKEYLFKTYQSQETIYQTMAHLWNIQRDPGEDIHSLGVKMEEKCMEVHSQIEAKFKKLKSTDEKEATFDSKNAFMLMASMLMVQHVQDKEPEAYKHMVNDIDGAVKPTEISIKAKSYIDKIGQSEPAAVNSGTFHGNNSKQPSKSNKKDQDCFFWKKNGRCNRKNCPFKHDSKYKKDKPANKNKTNLATQGDTKGGQPPKTTVQPSSTPQPTQQHPQAYHGAPYYPYHYPYMPPAPPQAGNSFVVSNERQMYDDPNYESCGQEVFHRD